MYGDLNEIDQDGIKYRGVLARVPNPLKVAVLGLPTNEQMTTRLEAQKSLRRTLGRRKSQTEFQPNLKEDLKLFQAIRQDKDGDEWDEFEASHIINKLLYCEVTEGERDGDDLFNITLKTNFGETKHKLRIPTQKAIQMYRRSVASTIELPHNVEEVRYRVGPSVELYDGVVVEVSGYTDAFTPKTVPPHHKSAVVVELVQAIEDLDPTFDPNF